MRQKPEWFYRQSSVVPFIVDHEELRIVLITSRKSKKWIVPKGIVEPGLSLQESAANEALEEAGVLGLVRDRPIGFYEYEKWGRICEVQVYALRVERILSEWQEMDFRERQVLPADEAVRLIENRDLAEIIKSYMLPELT